MPTGMKMMLCWISGYGFGIVNTALTFIKYDHIVGGYALLIGAVLMLAMFPIFLDDLKKPKTSTTKRSKRYNKTV